jgi:hypothetical protein
MKTKKVFMPKAFMLKEFMLIVALLIVGSIPAYADGSAESPGGTPAPGGNSGGSMTWIAVSNTSFKENIAAMAYGGGRFVAGGDSGKIAYSIN